YSQRACWVSIAEHDIELLHYAETPADAFAHLRDHLIAHHLEPHTEQEAATPGIAKPRGRRPHDTRRTHEADRAVQRRISRHRRSAHRDRRRAARRAARPRQVV